MAEFDIEKAHADLIEQTTRLKRGLFGQQKSLLDYYDLAQKISFFARERAKQPTSGECPECKRRRAQTLARTHRTRAKAAKKR